MSIQLVAEVVEEEEGVEDPIAYGQLTKSVEAEEVKAHISRISITTSTIPFANGSSYTWPNVAIPMIRSTSTIPVVVAMPTNNIPSAQA